MKQLFIALSLFTALSAAAQTKGNATLYGYVQYVSRGKAPEPDAGGLKTSEGARKNYVLYAASSSRIYPLEIWVEGVRYGVSVRTVQTPVEYGDEAGVGLPKEVLVPKTAKTVIQLAPAPGRAPKTTSATGKRLAGANEVVLIYKQNGKLVYSTQAKLKKLAAAAGM